MHVLAVSYFDSNAAVKTWKKNMVQHILGSPHSQNMTKL
jgi:hypothetical protein